MILNSKHPDQTALLDPPDQGLLCLPNDYLKEHLHLRIQCLSLIIKKNYKEYESVTIFDSLWCYCKQTTPTSDNSCGAA